MKRRSHKARFHPRKPTTSVRLGLVFGAIFGGLMLAIGLSQIFAAQVAYSIVPTTQTANANDTRAITIHFNTAGQTVHGGSVVLVFNTAQLQFVSFTKISNEFSVSNQRASSTGYAFDFESGHPNGTSGNFQLASVALKAKAVTTTTSSAIKFSSATTAYKGKQAQSREYYPVSGVQGVIVIQASTTSTPPSTTNPPATTPTPTDGTQPTETNPTPNPGTTEPIDETESPAVTTPDDNSEPPATISAKKIPPLAIGLIAAGSVGIAGTGGAYFYYRRRHLGHHPIAKDSRPPTPKTLPVPDKTPPKAPTTKEAQPPPKPAAESAPTAPSETIPVVPPPPEPTATVGPPPPPPPAETPTTPPAPDRASAPHPNSVARTIQPPAPRPNSSPLAPTPAPPAAKDEPPDMFELAKEHPESFGSERLYEEETKASQDTDSAQPPKT